MKKNLTNTNWAKSHVVHFALVASVAAGWATLHGCSSSKTASDAVPTDPSIAAMDSAAAAGTDVPPTLPEGAPSPASSTAPDVSTLTGTGTDATAQNGAAPTDAATTSGTPDSTTTTASTEPEAKPKPRKKARSKKVRSAASMESSDPTVAEPMPDAAPTTLAMENTQPPAMSAPVQTMAPAQQPVAPPPAPPAPAQTYTPPPRAEAPKPKPAPALEAEPEEADEPFYKKKGVIFGGAVAAAAIGGFGYLRSRPKM